MTVALTRSHVLFSKIQYVQNPKLFSNTHTREKMDLPLSVLGAFEAHRTRLAHAARQRRDLVAFKNIVFDKQERSATSIVDTLGKRQPGDQFNGDTNLRTLRTLLTMIDQRGIRITAPVMA